MSLPLFPLSWMDEAVRNKLLESARTERAAQAQHRERIENFKKHYVSEAQNAKMHQERLNDSLSQIRSSWTDAALSLDSAAIRVTDFA